MEAFFEFEGRILLFVQEYFRNDFLTPLFRGITALGNAGIFWILLAIVFLLNPKMRRVGVMGLLALLLSVLVNNLLLKNIVARTRPYEVIEGLSYLGKRPSDFSFPSGHTAASFAAAAAFYRGLPRRTGIPLLIVAGLIAFSRIYLGVHFPSDVLVGAADGIILGLTAAATVTKWYEKNR